MLTNAAMTKIWLALLALTLLEVALAFPHLSPILFLLVLLALSFGKSILIAGWFMHLKFEVRSLLYVLLPFLIVCIGLLLAFLPDAARLKELRP
ncbi:MAG: cytochrome C oxidase subunit IV family protein [Bryobacterales bacterium]|nr:cytochrome C oxidase subunit IV family protein [Bryobacterales bacterium]